MKKNKYDWLWLFVNKAFLDGISLICTIYILLIHYVGVSEGGLNYVPGGNG